ncbi:hypothetical protein PUN28_007160 [Cardiocondyla obscurior]|uniref:Uncharacterized protein n=1 Tax=Cardiocondyla obscurior TaxID=286306 RepID=A0AAW2G4V8_9HYME
MMYNKEEGRRQGCYSLQRKYRIQCPVRGVPFEVSRRQECYVDREIVICDTASRPPNSKPESRRDRHVPCAFSLTERQAPPRRASSTSVSGTCAFATNGTDKCNR